MAETAIDYDALARQHGGVLAVDYESLAKQHGGERAEHKPVIHASNNVEELRASAERQAPTIGDAAKAATESVPGAKLEAVRSSKDSDRIEDKAERQGVAPSQIADIAAAKVTVPDQAAAAKVLANLHEQLPVEKAEGAVTGDPQNNAVRQVQAIVDTQAPAQEPVKKAEILVQTPEMHAATESTHDAYRKAQELRATGKDAEADAFEAKMVQKHEAAEQAARERQEATSALQKSRPTSVFQRPPQENGSSGSGRGRVQSSEQGQEPPSESSQATREKEKAVTRQPGQAPIPAARIQELQAKLSTSANVSKAPRPPGIPENLKGQAVEVRDIKTGDWKPGRVLADNITGIGNGIRRLRGIYDDGTKFDNVKIRDVRKGVGVPNGTGRKTPDVAVDFDGTLAKETGTDKLGEALPERVKSIQRMLDDGKEVVIFTRRVENDHSGTMGKKIQDWLEKNGLPRLQVTDIKDAKEIYDNNAHHAPTDANTPLMRSNNAKKAQTA